MNSRTLSVTQDLRGRINTSCTLDMSAVTSDRQAAVSDRLSSMDSNQKERRIQPTVNRPILSREPKMETNELKLSHRQLGSSDRQLGSSDRQLGSSDRQLGSSDRQLGSSDRQLGVNDRQLGVNDRQLSTCDWIGSRAEEIELDGSWFQPKLDQQANHKRTGR